MPNYCLRLTVVPTVIVFFLILVSACAAPTKTDVKLETATEPIQATQEAVVLFPTYRTRSEAHEMDFMHCVKRKLEKEVPHRIEIFDTETFQDSLFPWFEPQYSPSNIQELDSIISRRLVRDRIASLGVRYLVSITSNSSSDGFPGMFCGGGYGAAGCLGLSWEDKIHKVDAVIFDIVKGTRTSALSVETSGRSLAFAFVIPVVFVAYTEREACEALAIELSRLFIDNTDSNH